VTTSNSMTILRTSALSGWSRDAASSAVVRAGGVAEPVAVDEPELVEEEELELGLRIVLHARDHLSIRALEPVQFFASVRMRTHRFEDVEPLIVDVERLIVEIGAAQCVAEALAIDIGERHERLHLLRALLHLGQVFRARMRASTSRPSRRRAR